MANEYLNLTERERRIVFSKLDTIMVKRPEVYTIVKDVIAICEAEGFFENIAYLSEDEMKAIPEPQKPITDGL